MQSRSKSLSIEEGEEDKKVVVALDLGASKLRIGIFKKGKLLDLNVVNTPQGLDEKGFISAIIKEVKQLLEKHNLNDILGIGIATIGPLDLKAGRVINTPNIIPHTFELRDPLGDMFRTRVVMANDCVAAIWGEYVLGGWGSYHDQAYVTLSTGVGVGVIVDGNLLLGRRGNSHELGHAVINFESELRCGCGKRGHWEAFVGGRNFRSMTKALAEGWRGQRSVAYKEAIVGRLDAPEAFKYARSRDPFAEHIVDFVSRASAAGLSTVIAAYDPEVIHLGGSIYLNNEDLLLPRIKSYLSEYSVFEPPIIKRTTFESLTPLYGAASLVYRTPKNLEKYVYVP